MIPREFDSISRDDLQRLIDNQVAETRTLEYKRDIYSLKDNESKRGFLADVSAFANTDGGDIICGLEADGGLPTKIHGHSFDFDGVRLQMVSMLRDNLEPSLLNVSFGKVDVGQGKAALVIRTPKSWAAPHRVTAAGHGHFYLRTSGSVERMDVPELRRAFLLGETVAERIRAFRAERFIKVAASDTPTVMEAGAKVIFHIIPLSAFSGGRADLQLTMDQRLQFAPPAATNLTTRINLDGFVSFFCRDKAASVYLQFFRTGIVEVVQTVEYIDEDRSYFMQSWYEEHFLTAGTGYLAALNRFGIGPPYYVFLSCHGVKGLLMFPGKYPPRSNKNAADRDTLFVPEGIVEDESAFRSVMISMYSIVWNAFGHENARSFDEQGKYIGP